MLGFLQGFCKGCLSTLRLCEGFLNEADRGEKRGSGSFHAVLVGLGHRSLLEGLYTLNSPPVVSFKLGSPNSLKSSFPSI